MSQNPVRNTMLVILANLVVVFIILELALTIYFDFFSLNYDLEIAKYIKMLKVDDKILGHVHRPNKNVKIMGEHIKTNSRGMCNEELPYEKPADTVRILALGDSLLFGWGVPYNETFIKLLERNINKNGNFKYEIINTGHPGYNAEKEYLYLVNEGIKYKPDYVFVFYYINDVEPYQKLKDNSWISWSKTLTLCYALFKRAMGTERYKNYYDELYKNDNMAWIECRRYIAKTINFCKANNIKPFYIILPELQDVKTYKFFSIHKKVKEVIEMNNASFLDLYYSVKDIESSKLWISRSDTHPNVLCSKIYSDAIYKYLVNNSEIRPTN